MNPRPGKRRRFALILTAVLVVLSATLVGVVACAAPRRGAAPVAVKDDGASIIIDDFEGWAANAASNEAWVHETFSDISPTIFRVREERGGKFLSASTDGGGSLLTRPLDLDPTEYSVLRFRWRVRALPKGADVRVRAGDDCGIRVFVTFAYEPEHATFAEKIARGLASRDLPGSSLCYVWTEGVAAGTVVPNAYTDRTQMVVVRSGRDGLGRWSAVERNIRADYIAAFDREPPRITGIAIMVDADQTASHAAADIDDIELRRPR